MYLLDKILNRVPEQTRPEVTNRRRLISALRDKSQWPKSFEWDYQRSKGCAIGLSRAIGSAPGWGEGWDDHWGLSVHDLCRVVAGAGGAIDKRLVTPEMVAEALEKAPYV
jgi:hypothetical protein